MQRLCNFRTFFIGGIDSNLLGMYPYVWRELKIQRQNSLDIALRWSAGIPKNVKFIFESCLASLSIKVKPISA